MTTPHAPSRPWWTERAANPDLPLWLRIAAYAEAHADPHGHTPLRRQQLHRDVDPLASRTAISHAIARAVQLGWLHPASSARCLVLARAGAGAPCTATHRRWP